VVGLVAMVEQMLVLLLVGHVALTLLVVSSLLAWNVPLLLSLVVVGHLVRD